MNLIRRSRSNRAPTRIWISILWSLGLISLLFLTAAPQAAVGSEQCSWNQPLVALQDRMRLAPGALERMSLFGQYDMLRVKIARSFPDRYFSGRLGGELDRDCLEPLKDAETFLQLAQDAFLTRSLERLSRTKLHRLQKLIRLLGIQRDAEPAFAFRLTGEGFSESPTEMKAGFHRATKSIFMDLSRIEPTEWFVILAHELIHYADTMIPAGIEKYSNTAIPQKLIAAAQLTDNPNELSLEDRLIFKDWIQAGMDRGLLAEVRAWAITILIYEDGLRAGTWGHIGWLDEVLRERRRAESAERFALRILSSRSHQLHEGAFAHNLARNLLEEVKRELLERKRPLKFGALESMIK